MPSLNTRMDVESALGQEEWSPAESFSDIEWRNYQQQLDEEHLKLDRDIAEYDRKVQRQTRRRTGSEPKPARPTKFGRCLTCKHALRPKVWLSAGKAGRASLLCARWWRRLPGGKRACWFSIPAKPEELQLFPRGLQDLYYSLRMRLLRGGL